MIFRWWPLVHQDKDLRVASGLDSRSPWCWVWVGTHLRALCFSFPVIILRRSSFLCWDSQLHLGGAHACAWSWQPVPSQNETVECGARVCSVGGGCLPGLCVGSGRGTRLLHQMTEALVTADLITVARRRHWRCRAIVMTAI